MTDPNLELDLAVDERIELPEAYASADLHAVVASVLRAEGAAGTWAITIQLTNDAELQTLHRDYLNDDTPTDIMTFPNEPDDIWAGIGPSLCGGDIAISVDSAAAQAADGGWDTLGEIRFLVAHGVLHLLGWDDSTPEKRVRMHDRQRQILAGIDAGSDGLEELA